MEEERGFSLSVDVGTTSNHINPLCDFLLCISALCGLIIDWKLPLWNIHNNRYQNVGAINKLTDLQRNPFWHSSCQVFFVLYEKRRREEL